MRCGAEKAKEEVTALKSFFNRDYDWRGNLPGVLKKAAVRTVLLTLLAVVLLPWLA